MGLHFILHEQRLEEKAQPCPLSVCSQDIMAKVHPGEEKRRKTKGKPSSSSQHYELNNCRDRMKDH